MAENDLSNLPITGYGTLGAVPVEGIAGGVTIPVTATIPGTVDVSDRAGRLVGIVDTELPAAAALNDAVANPTVPTIGADLSGFNGASWDRLRSSGDNADALATITLGVIRALAEGLVFNGTTWDRVRGDTTQGMQVGLKRTTLIQNTGALAANTAITLTLGAVASQFHYITHIYIARVATAALAGGAILEITTTNLNGIRWVTGNQASITISTFDDAIVTDAEFVHPIKSAVVNTASTIVFPVPGVAVSWRAWVAYYTGP